MSYKKIFLAASLSCVVFLIMPWLARAQTSGTDASSSAATVEALQKQVQLLLNQMASLQKEISSLKSGAAAPTTSTAIPPATVSAPSSEVEDETEIEEAEIEFISPPILTRSLFRGSRGEDVRQLQEFLAQDSDIYPEGIITGYYGVGTEAAVKKWQAKNGIPAVGIVGRQTIAKFKTFVETYSPLRPTIPDVDFPVRPNSCPVYAYMPICKEGQSFKDANGCQVCQQKTQPEFKKAICPAMPTVVSCPAGEEKVVAYKSEQCGVYYSCKPSKTSRTENTVAILKKSSPIQTDNRYTLILNDPDGIQSFSVSNAKGAEVQTGYPACSKDWNTPTFIIDSAGFPPKLTLNDCGSPSSRYTTTLSTPVIVQQVSEGQSFPYTFANGKIVNSNSEARSYCYANGPASGQGVAAECETKFGIVYYQTTTTTTAGSSGRAVYSSDSFANCMTKYGFGVESKQIKVWAQASDPMPWSILSSSAQNAVTICEKEYYGQGTVETGAAMCADGKDNDGDGFIDSADSSCGSGYTVTPPSGQKEQIWNSLGLKSWIKSDTDSNRIAQLKLSCASAPYSSNIWMPNAGVSTSVDFGMPDAARCQKASMCMASQYFDGASCVVSTATPTSTSVSIPSSWAKHTWSFRDGYTEGSYILNRTDQEYSDFIARIHAQCLTINKNQFAWLPNAGSDAASNWQNFGIPNCSGTASTQTTILSCSSSVPEWPVQYGSYCLNNSRTQYVPLSSPYASSAQSCAGADSPVAGCTPPGGGTTSTYTDTCSQYGSGWHIMGDNNCYNSGMTEYRTANGTLYSCSATPSSGCSSSGTATTGSCGSGYYWNGSTCVSSSSTTGSSCPSGQYWYTPPSGGAGYCQSSSSSGTSTTCSSGQYWNGTACVTSTTSGSSCSTPANCFDSAVCSSSGWYWYNGGCWSSPQSSQSSTTSSSSTTCPSGQYWNGSSCVTTSTTDCASGQYWNGSSCVASTSSGSTTSCPSGNYWNGSACVPSTTPSASVYDQMRKQLKSMEIILQGLLGR